VGAAAAVGSLLHLQGAVAAAVAALPWEHQEEEEEGVLRQAALPWEHQEEEEEEEVPLPPEGLVPLVRGGHCNHRQSHPCSFSCRIRPS
jgi:hypothetical protein